MELKVQEPKLPEQILFNYEELKTELTEKVEKYKTMVYTEDQIKEAKADKASLNKLKKALNDERIRREKEYMAPFNVFKKQINEIIAIIDEPVGIIDQQVKEFEEKRKRDKSIQIGSIWMSKENRPSWLKLHEISDDRWLNVSVSLKSIEEEIDEKLEKINNDLAIIQELPEFSFEAVDEYKRTRDLNKAISEGKRLAELQKRKQEAEEAKAKAEEEAKAKAAAEAKAEKEAQPEPTPEIKPEEPQQGWHQPDPEPEEKQEAGQWVAFQALLTVENAHKLKAFFDNNNIEFRRIKTWEN